MYSPEQGCGSPDENTGGPHRAPDDTTGRPRCMTPLILDRRGGTRMTVVLNRKDDALRLSEEAWTAALVASLAHGWQRQDVGSLTYRDLALLLPDPEYDA